MEFFKTTFFCHTALFLNSVPFCRQHIISLFFQRKHYCKLKAFWRSVFPLISRCYLLLCFLNFPVSSSISFSQAELTYWSSTKNYISVKLFQANNFFARPKFLLSCCSTSSTSFFSSSYLQKKYCLLLLFQF